MNSLLSASLLLVEDMEEMRNIVRRLLGAMGFTNITLARNGEEAWRLIQAQSFDLVLCDWNMPKMSGRELLERVRQEPAYALLPFIMITGENAQSFVKSAIDGGVTDFILKPFTAALLEQRVHHALGLPPVPNP
ncbi:response regulator [Rhodoferax saidenbachensis]|uniref:CheY-like chemotaxis protein n=1 Tax=Rhodoferax saidenbachensis TaxID=1484693 RepID=A0ABU1ZLD0_9BURK|nr:response regulator [Rhodoferax saidenbachensis]MDR7306343.1 CheY-like chemotaxis protein [Rhodoferax saidenbachensis]